MKIPKAKGFGRRPNFHNLAFFGNTDADSSSENRELTSVVADVIVRDMRNGPPRIPTSYHLFVCVAVQSEVERKTILVAQSFYLMAHHRTRLGIFGYTRHQV
ncbi:hypothetical protein AVEN_167419-1 [Araneus ventricosus]|uniref:Uncharacterized protein n=1 Tax=Araneus ventricosus TaxID=182803 RepID=A0A4Y2K9B0_ARAVE|nr:hypothetical protein AVEN_167419-1 [Araneus ventricosus]